MNYKIPFFAAQSFLLAATGYFRWRLVLAGKRGYALMGDLYCPIDAENGSTFLLLFLLLGSLMFLWGRPKSKLLWWLNLTGMMVLFYSCNPWGSPAFLSLWCIAVGLGALHFRERFIQPERPRWSIVASIILALVVSVPSLIYLMNFAYFIDQSYLR